LKDAARAEPRWLWLLSLLPLVGLLFDIVIAVRWWRRHQGRNSGAAAAFGPRRPATAFGPRRPATASR
jgi:hypothetical protein